jgi:FixJ family two-component response regulator
MENPHEHNRVKGTAGASDARRVSIVDDDESVRVALTSLLRSVGFDVYVFARAEDFLHSDYRHDTACLILDVRMPGMSGLELQRQLAATDCRIPIIFITAHDDEATRAQALQSGAAAFLSKPFGEEALLTAVYAALKFN